MSERDELDAELQALIDKYGGYAVQRALEQSEWGKAELKRLLDTPRVPFLNKKREDEYTKEILELIMVGKKSD